MKKTNNKTLYVVGGVLLVLVLIIYNLFNKACSCAKRTAGASSGSSSEYVTENKLNDFITDLKNSLISKGNEKCQEC